MALTDEQAALASAATQSNVDVVKGQAFAGTGKTHVLAEIASHARKPLYLAFNKAIQHEAQGRFPAHTVCRTAHALAFRHTGVAQARNRLEQRLMPDDVAAFLELADADTGDFRPTPAGMLVIRTLQAYCASDAAEITADHVPLDGGLARRFARLARRLWADLADFSRGVLPIPHDVYFKLWQLRGAPGLEPYSIILFDEAQDASPVMLDAVQQAERPVVYIGDRYQGIYGFRGAENALTAIAGIEFPLTQSFRFGPAVARTANAWLAEMPESHRPAYTVRGNPDIMSTAQRGDVPDDAPLTVLTRTNGAALEAAGEAAEHGSVHVVGGIRDVEQQIYSALDLKAERFDRIRDPLIAKFGSWNELKQFVEETGDPELGFLQRMIERRGRRIVGDLKAIRKAWAADDKRAWTTISTAHRAKGREFERVELADDFPSSETLQKRSRDEGISRDLIEEWHLGYVARTRAIHHLHLHPDG